MPCDITVYCSKAEKIAEAKQFAQQHHFTFSDQINNSGSLFLNFDEDFLILHDDENKTSLSIDFTQGAIAHRLQFGGGKGQAIAKAIGITAKNKPHILDATAGLGRDALVLANLGCQLTLIEQSAILFAMLQQAKNFAEENNLFTQATAQGFEIIHADAVQWMQKNKLETTNKIEPDVIYLDPMYPDSKKSALVKKDMQILQKMLGHSTEQALSELLDNALQLAKQRVVIKRPKAAKPLDGPSPTMAIHSKKTRYDVYVIKALSQTKQ